MDLELKIDEKACRIDELISQPKLCQTCNQLQDSQDKVLTQENWGNVTLEEL